MRVLLVNVTPSQRGALKSLLPEDQYDVVECSPTEAGGEQVTAAHWDLVVIRDPKADRSLWRHLDLLPTSSLQARNVVIHSERGYRPELMTNLLQAGHCRHFVGGGTPQTDVTLAQTIRQLLGKPAWDLTSDSNREVPKIERRITSSSEKRDVLHQIEQWCRGLDVRQRQTNAIIGVADECLMNAMYHAPVDAAGTRPYAARPRGGELELSPNEAPTIRVHATDDQIAVMTRDPFGSLVGDTAIASVLACMTRALDPMSSRRPGTGMGLYLTFCNSSHVNIAIHPGRLTELVVLINRTATFRESAAQPKGLTVFSHR